MTDASEDIKKSSRGRPKADTTPVMVRMAPEELAAVDSWISANGPPYVTRPEAIRRLVEAGLSIPNYGSLKDAAEKSGQDIARMIEQVIFVADRRA